MNPHKEAWYSSIQVGDARRPDVRAKFRSYRERMFKGHSDKTKWERIGRPLFVDTPLEVAEFYLDIHFRFSKLKKML